MKNKFAFTLSEVLITLVIIGVVAGLTIPTAISKYRKKVVATRLKAAYSTVANAIRLSAVKYGSEMYETTGGINIERIEKYIIPFVNAKYFGQQNSSIYDMGYTKILYPDGNTVNCNSMAYGCYFSTSITLPNATFIGIGYNLKKSSGFSYTANGYRFMVDVDGPHKGPNTFGKDIFFFISPFATPTYNLPLFVLRQYGSTFLEMRTREENMDDCKAGGETSQNCGALIINDGWEVADDYPWL